MYIEGVWCVHAHVFAGDVVSECTCERVCVGVHV